MGMEATSHVGLLFMCSYVDVDMSRGVLKIREPRRPLPLEVTQEHIDNATPASPSCKSVRKK
jgi:hypothetical protein